MRVAINNGAAMRLVDQDLQSVVRRVWLFRFKLSGRPVVRAWSAF